MKLKLISVIVLMFLFASEAMAGGCFPGEPCAVPDKPVVKKTVSSPVVPPVAAPAETCGWNANLGVGVPIWFFQEEDTNIGGGVYADVYHCNSPLNFRIGAEVSHINLDQSTALSSAEFPGKQVQISFVRIPISVEYKIPLSENTDFLLGAGPDIINTANDISDTSVGFHLSGRLAHDLTDSIGVSLEAGYMFGEVETDDGQDVDLDNAFIIPSLFYKF